VSALEVSGIQGSIHDMDGAVFNDVLDDIHAELLMERATP